VPVYGGIECAKKVDGEKNLTPDQYRYAATELIKVKSDGIYLFKNFY